MAQKYQARWQLRINQYIGIALICFLFLAANYIGYKHYFRKNVSLNTYTQLGSQTLSILNSLPSEVKIINFATPEGDATALLIMPDVAAVLEEYRYNSKGKVEIIKVDPFVNFVESKRYADLYKVSEKENVLIIDFKGQKKIVAYSDLADIDNSLAMLGGAPTVKSFKAEKAITSAIQALVEGKKSKVYFLSGHGEYDPTTTLREKSGYGIIADYINRQNVEIAQLNLLAAGNIPLDMDLLVIAGPKTSLLPVELEIIAQYLERTDKPARLLIMLDPKTQTGLETLLKPYGIIFNNDQAMTKVSVLGQVRVYGDVLAESYASHPVTEWIGKSGVNLNFRAGRSLTITTGAQVIPLALSPKSYWGETELDSLTPDFAPDKDKQGPLVMAAVVDKGSVADGGVKLKGAKIVAVGSASFLINQFVDVAPLDFFLNSMNWMLDKDQALGITPKRPEEFNVQLGDQQLQASFLLIAAIPVLGLGLGVLVWFRRRK